jgi:hypothetical protein
MPARTSRSGARHPEKSFPIGTKVHIGSSDAYMHGVVTVREKLHMVVHDETGKDHELSWNSKRVCLCACNQ